MDNEDNNEDNNDSGNALDAPAAALWKKWVIAIATILPILFFLGFLESYCWFSRLMIGRSCLRGGTVCWILISLWVLCFTRIQDGRPEPEQVVLRQMWKETPRCQRLRLWRKWGFRHKYPDVLQLPAPAQAQQIQHLESGQGASQKETIAAYQEQQLDVAPPAYQQVQEETAHPDQVAHRTSDMLDSMPGARW
jgi:hypothetical protein